MTEYTLSRCLGGATFKLTAPEDSELDVALTNNSRLPDRDVDLSAGLLAPLAVPGLPVSLASGAIAGLSSCRRLEDALSRAGLASSLPEFAGKTGCRYTILYGRVDGSGQAGVAAPLVQGVTAQAKASASGGLRFAVVAAVPEANGAADQFRPVLENLTVPSQIRNSGDLADSVAILMEAAGNLSLSAGVNFGYDVTWLREVSAGRIEGDVGVHLEPNAKAALDIGLAGSFVQCVTREPDGWMRLRVSKLAKQTGGLGLDVQVGAKAVEQLPQSATALLDGLMVGAGVAASAALGSLPQTIYQGALSALEKKYTADLSYRLDMEESGEALIDASFDLDHGGLGAWVAALKGDFATAAAAPSACVRFRQAVLTHRLARQSRLELHLPFLNAQEWQKRLEALGKAEIAEDAAGRMMVYTVAASDRAARVNSYQSTLLLTGAIRRKADFTLAYNDVRQVSARSLSPVLDAYGFPAQAGEWAASLPAGTMFDSVMALSVPGAGAAAWLDAPLKGEPEFLAVFSRVSTAIQAVMRRWLPFTYFADPKRYDDLRAAWPLLVYQASRPCGGTQLAYDAQDRESVGAALRSAAPGLPALLALVERTLSDAGRAKTASFYAPSQAGSILNAVAQDQRLFQSLLIGDALFVDRLVALGAQARAAKDDPANALAGLTRFSAALVSAFHDKLRRLYGDQDFLPLGSLILLEATAALGSTAASAQVPGIMRLSAQGQTRTFVNAAYRPGVVSLDEPAAASIAQPSTARMPEAGAKAKAATAPACPTSCAVAQPVAFSADPADAVFRDALELSAGLSIEPAAYFRSAVEIYNQVCRCRKLKSALSEQTAILTALIG